MAMAGLQAGLHAPFSASLPLDHSLSRTSTLPSSTKPIPKDRSKRHSHHGINSHHRHHHHRRKSRDDNDQKVPQSAFVTSNPFESFLHHSHHSSRSSQRLPDELATNRGEREKEAAAGRARKEIKDAKERDAQWQDVERLRRERKETEESATRSHLVYPIFYLSLRLTCLPHRALRASLTHLQSLGTATTRRLDYAYYNLLSSIPLLHASLSELQSLSEQTSQLKTHLLSQIPALEAQTQAQLAALTSGYGALKDETKNGKDVSAQQRIMELEERMRVAKEKVESLGERVEGVRQSIDEFESREREGRERSGWWLRICWVCLSLGVGFWVLLVGLGVKYHGDLGSGLEVSVANGAGFEALAAVGGELGEAITRWNMSREAEEPREEANQDKALKADTPAWERILDEL